MVDRVFRFAGPIILEQTSEITIPTDWHIGADTHDKSVPRKYMRWVGEEENRYFITLGDMCEMALPGRGAPGTSLDHQILKPSRQVRKLCSLIDPVRDRYLGGVGGNHEQRAKKSGLDLVDILAERFEMQYYAEYAMSLELRVGTQRYYLYLHHGSGGGRDFWQLDKLIKNNSLGSNFDAVLMGHTHGLASHLYDITFRRGSSIFVDGKTWGIRCGSASGYTPYNLEKMHEAKRMGHPILRFHGDRQRIDVGIDLEHVPWYD